MCFPIHCIVVKSVKGSDCSTFYSSYDFCLNDHQYIGTFRLFICECLIIFRLILQELHFPLHCLMLKSAKVHYSTQIYCSNNSRDYLSSLFIYKKFERNLAKLVGRAAFTTVFSYILCRVEYQQRVVIPLTFVVDKIQS